MKRGPYHTPQHRYPTVMHFDRCWIVIVISPTGINTTDITTNIAAADLVADADGGQKYELHKTGEKTIVTEL